MSEDARFLLSTESEIALRTSCLEKGGIRIQSGRVLSVKVTKCKILRGAPFVETAGINQQRSFFDMLSTHGSTRFFFHMM